MKSAKEILCGLMAQQRPMPARSVRVVLSTDAGEPLVDIDSALALRMLDCNYGKPIARSLTADGVRLTLTLKEGGA